MEETLTDVISEAVWAFQHSEQLGLIPAFVCEKTNPLLAPNTLKECLQSKSLIPRDELVFTSYLLKPTGSNFVQRSASWALTSCLVTCQKNSANPKVMVARNLFHQSCPIYQPHDNNLSLLHKRKVKMRCWNSRGKWLISHCTHIYL